MDVSAPELDRPELRSLLLRYVSVRVELIDSLRLAGLQPAQVALVTDLPMRIVILHFKMFAAAERRCLEERVSVATSYVNERLDVGLLDSEKDYDHDDRRKNMEEYDKDLARSVAYQDACDDDNDDGNCTDEDEG